MRMKPEDLAGLPEWLARLEWVGEARTLFMFREHERFDCRFFCSSRLISRITRSTSVRVMIRSNSSSEIP
jgi:hypothetical protein